MEMMESSRKRRASHIPTTLTTVPSRHEQSKKQTENFLCGPWKSGNPKAGFPLSHHPGSLRRKVKSSSSHGRRGAAAQGVDPRTLLFPVGFGPHHGPPGRHANRILNRQVALMEMSISQPNMQFAVELVAHLHFLAGISLL